ncbi:LysM peptidoglycan-binding domain-containing protein [Alphaproteobacteria bacterium KMM 3653]|uniref:LysM peptidoglycan-binding domain-containing protein n=1 Tax=Harenicola maris TaxID=2841044 RepID=A0AAP2CMT9_9RHOB|nr:LysM peptidoglycan-binding domain-containing protein [Harenicola maris]
MPEPSTTARSRTPLIAGLLVFGLGFGGAVFFAQQGKTPEGQGALAPIATDPTTAPTTDLTTAPEIAETTPEAPPEPEASPTAPSFDVVRVDPQGGALIAGRAEPGQSVQLMLDGVEVSNVQTQEGGGFVAMLDLPGSEAPQVLTLTSSDEEGPVASSEASVILAPILAPEAEEAEEDESAPITDNSTETAEPTEPTPADPPRAVLLASAEGVKVLQPATRASTAPASLPAKALVLDAISYGTDGSVVLTGRGKAAPETASEDDTGHVRIYLDNTAVKTAPLAPDGTWESPLSDVAEGVYTLRVDQLDAEGRVASRFETPFKRESAAVLDRALDRARPVPAETGAALTVQVVTVQPGATLWAIASDRYGDGTAYVKVFEANASQIRDADLIYPGQVFDLPE